MLICDKRQFVFVHIPTNSGTPFRHAVEKQMKCKKLWGIVGNMDIAHLTPAEAHDLSYNIPESYNRMCIVRDPYERFISAYEHHVGHLDKHWGEKPLTRKRMLKVLKKWKDQGLFDKKNSLG